MRDLGVLGFDGPGTDDAVLAGPRGLAMAAGELAGAGCGVPSGSLADRGASDPFSLGKRATPDKALQKIEPLRPRAVKTSLAREQEDRLRAGLRATPKVAA